MTFLACLLHRHQRAIWAFLLSLVLLLLSLTQVLGQSPRMNTVLYGASYYHEYMPYDRLEKDIELMQQAGITVVRLGESPWTSWDPREGEFEFAWMQRILDCLNGAGIPRKRRGGFSCGTLQFSRATILISAHERDLPQGQPPGSPGTPA